MGRLETQLTGAPPGAVLQASVTVITRVPLVLRASSHLSLRRRLKVLMQSPEHKLAELDSTSEPRPTLHQARLLSRAVVNPWRLLPSFLIIGAQRSGTSSLFNYLAEHPLVGPPIRKEIHYFTTRYDHGDKLVPRPTSQRVVPGS